MNIEAIVTQVDALILTETGKHLSDLQAAILTGSLAGQKYEAIANLTFCTEGHIKDVASALWKQLSQIYGEAITKKTLKTILPRQLSLSNLQPQIEPQQTGFQYWGDAPDVTLFQGRESEQQTLQTWIVEDHCRLVLVLGMGGIGKSSLVTKVAQVVMSDFNGIVWRSLRNAPPLAEMLVDLNQTLNPNSDLSGGLDPRIQIVETLRRWRWLIVFDNVESILVGGDRSGQYREGYEGYGELWKTLAETNHQSCCLLTSREPPPGLVASFGATLPARSLSLGGLSFAASRAVVEMKGTLQGTPQQWEQLIQRYGGHPLALKIVTAAIENFFEGNLTQFLGLKEGPMLLFDDIRDLLAQQVNRLSDRGQEIMNWLAIKREPCSLNALHADLLNPGSLTEMIQEVAALQHRVLIEKHESGYTLQPVIMEYITTHFLQQAQQELNETLTHDTRWPNPKATLTRYSWMQAQAKDYVREIQMRVFLQPLIQYWISKGFSTNDLRSQLLEQLQPLRGISFQQSGYAGGNILNLLRLLPGDLKGLDLSHLILRHTNFQASPLHHVNLTQSDLTGALFSDNLGSVLSVALSPQGDRLAAGDMNGQIHVWDVQTGQKQLSVQAHRNWVRSITFSPSGAHLASAGFDNTIHVWDLEQGQNLLTFQGHHLGVYSVAFSPDGQSLASGSADHSIRLWSIRTGDCLQCWTGHQDWVNSVAFSPDGTVLLSGSKDATIKLWSLEKQTCLATFIDHEESVFTVAFHPDGRQFISGSADQTVGVWSIDQEHCLTRLVGHQNWVNSVTFALNGRFLISGSSDHTVKIWQLSTGECRQTLRGHDNAVWSVASHPQMACVASGSFDQTIKLWDCHTGHCLQSYWGYRNAIWSVVWSQTEDCVISGSTDHHLRVWHLESQNDQVIDCGHQSQVSQVLCTPDHQGLISSSFDQTLRLWDCQQQRVVQTLRGHQAGICTMAMNPAGTLLASGGFDQTILLWDLATGECLKKISGHQTTLWAIAFSPDGNTFASAGVDAVIRLWSLDSDSPIVTFQGHESAIWSLSFSPDGRWLVSGGVDQLVRLWDLESGDSLEPWAGHGDWIFSVAFSPDGQWIASGSADQSIRLWEVQGRSCQQILTGHDEKIYSVAFSPAGQSLASASQDESIRIWDLSTGECLHTLRPKRLYEQLNITEARGLTMAQRSTLKHYGAFEVERQ